MLTTISPSALDGLLFAQHQSSWPCQTACGITSRGQSHCMSGNRYNFAGNASLIMPGTRLSRQTGIELKRCGRPCSIC